MKALLEFNLPDDEEEFTNAVKGADYKSAIHNIKDYIRTIWKYQELTEDQYKIVDEIYKHINQCSHGIDSI